MRAVLADTGPLYATVDPDDQYHARSQADLEQLDRDNLAVFVPYPVYLEAYSLVLYRLGSEKAILFAQEIIEGADLINPSQSDYLAATQLTTRFPDQRITLFDAVTAVMSERLNLPVWTYDYHFDVMQVSVWRNTQTN